MSKQDRIKACELAAIVLSGQEPEQKPIPYINIALEGYDIWAAKEHNKRWAKMIYHTPIPNDLPVCIAEAFRKYMSGDES